MLHLLPLAALPFLSVLNTTPSENEGDAFLTWKGEQMTLVEAASALPESTAQELEAWSAWCAQRGYQAVLDDEGRALLVASAQRRDLDELTQRALEAGKLLDALAPLPERDPDETFLVPEWGQGQHVPEHDTATVVLVEVEPDFASLLKLLEAIKPILAGHLPQKATVPAFHSGEASTGALLSAPRNVEIGTVWRAHNEVVNRLARLLLHRRFGELPYWIEMGLAWHVEHSVMGDLYSFPGREEFVSVDDHEGWKKELKEEFRKRRKKQPLRLDEFADWSSKRWDGHAASIAWGFAQFLVQQPPETVSAILEDLRLDMKNNGVEVHEDGSWQMVSGYAPSLERQDEILARHLGDEYLERVGNFFRTWKP